MNILTSLISRHMRLFFKDKTLFISSFIAPLIILALYVLFLGNNFSSMFDDSVQGLDVPSSLRNGFVATWEISSILATSCVTVAFMSNLVCVQDRVTGAIGDFTITPVKKSTLSMSYFISTALITLSICYVALLAGFVYVSIAGWYLSVSDVLFLLLDVLVMGLFGTAFSSIFSSFLKTNGGMSAVSVIVSSVYGFVCGAYVPLSILSEGIQKAITCFPWTYGTSLFRVHFMGGIYEGLSEAGLPAEALEGMKNGFDYNLSFFGNDVSVGVKYIVVIGGIALCTGIFLLISALRKKKRDN